MANAEHLDCLSGAQQVSTCLWLMANEFDAMTLRDIGMPSRYIVTAMSVERREKEAFFTQLLDDLGG